ncbi:hypothetical protein [Psychroserpens sp.]|uniref:hypothetical protein n=1 Tax=Psychroserpens sp. TaxID=2020870 RepID=UPI002B278FA3|nr:hypothetical protein [Psychroserpens sp.]
MKIRIVTSLLVCFTVCNTFAQDYKVRDIVTFIASVPVIENETILLSSSDFRNSKLKKFLEPNIKFFVVAINDSTVELRAVEFKSTPKKRRDALEGVGIEITEDYYFGKSYFIKLKDFIAFAEKVVPDDKISIGILTLPFKARPQEEFAFDTKFNLNSTLNVRLKKWNGISFYSQLGAGVGSVNLNTGNANGISDSEAQDVSILTFFSGVMLEYNKMQVGFYVGVDHINNQKNYDWHSHGNLWIGFGLGYNLFKLSSSEPKNVQAGS